MTHGADMQTTQAQPRFEKLTLVLTHEQRRQIEEARHALEQRGIRVSLSKVATTALMRGLREPQN